MKETLLPESTVTGDAEDRNVPALLDELETWEDTLRFWRGLPLALAVSVLSWSVLALVAYAVYRFLT